jgi:LPS export ABC transporter protein LptC
MILFSSNKIFFPAIIIATLLFSACENDIRLVQALGQKKVGIEEAKSIKAYQSVGGKVKAKLTAPLMYKYLFDTARYEFPNTLHVYFYDSAVHVESELFARFGSYYENDRKVFLKDSVIIFNVKHDTLWTTELTWDQDKQQFYTNKPVTISQESRLHQKMYADSGLIADQNLKNFTLLKTGPSRTGQDSYIIVPDSTY